MPACAGCAARPSLLGSRSNGPDLVNASVSTVGVRTAGELGGRRKRRKLPIDGLLGCLQGSDVLGHLLLSSEHLLQQPPHISEVTGFGPTYFAGVVVAGITLAAWSVGFSSEDLISSEGLFLRRLVFVGRFGDRQRRLRAFGRAGTRGRIRLYRCKIISCSK